MAWAFDADYTLVVLAKIAAPDLEARARAWFAATQWFSPTDKLEVDARKGGNGWNVLLLRCADTDLRLTPSGKSSKKTKGKPDGSLGGFLDDLVKTTKNLHYAIGYISIVPYVAKQVGANGKPSLPRDIFDLAEELGAPIADRPPSVIVEEPKRGSVDPSFYEAIVFTASEPTAIVRSTINVLGYEEHRGMDKVCLLRGSSTTHAILTKECFPDELTSLFKQATGAKVVKLNTDDDDDAWSTIDQMVS